ncbi:hypothetical protein TWF192_004956 [Orbilia oligospora]|uniref:Uncharacterized protein n=2 Tax=Orbilia oligospora TaxID=2813651 RepID=A0A6G1MA66_ORBOL|nr:hypothetical protein TWF679_000439 [Orbilia oligospora]KAF3251463.1 hypothetical protein TWF192_004956 [Orbilia oligospora]
MEGKYPDQCVCGYHKRCMDGNGKAIDHGLTVWQLRDGGYAGRCNQIFDLVPENMQAADHIIELWQVKEAYFRALQYLAQFDSAATWYVWDTETYGDSITTQDANAVRNRLYLGLGYGHVLSTLHRLRRVFNDPENLCAIDKNFNLRKNKYLDQPVPIIPGGEREEKILGDAKFGETYMSTRRQLRSYYLATTVTRQNIMNRLQLIYHDTGDVALYLVKCYLEQNYRDFLSECPNEVIVATKMYPKDPGSQGPIEYLNSDDRAAVVDGTVNMILGSLSDEEKGAIEQAWKTWGSRPKRAKK